MQSSHDKKVDPTQQQNLENAANQKKVESSSKSWSTTTGNKHRVKPCQLEKDEVGPGQKGGPDAETNPGEPS